MQPFLKEIPRSTQVVDNFRGYNHNLRIGVNEFYDEENLSSDDAPVLSVRKPRKVIETDLDLEYLSGIFLYQPHTNQDEYYELGMTGRTKYQWVALYEGELKVLPWNPYRDETRTVLMSGRPVFYIEGTKQICLKRKDGLEMFGSEFEDVEQLEYIDQGNATIANVDANGFEIQAKFIGDTNPEAPVNGDYWVDTSGTDTVLKKYSVTTKMWVTVPTAFVRIRGTLQHPSSHLYPKDGVFVKVYDIQDGIQYTINSSNIIEKVRYSNWNDGTMYIDCVITGTIAKKYEAKAKWVNIQRLAPIMNKPIVSNNRMWTCAPDGDEIFASALGDPRNWYRYFGQADDSYAVTVGTPGKFTGSCAFQGKAYFFKEDYCHVVTGVNPPFQVKQMQVLGVQSGCEKSVVVMNDVVVYKSRRGICIFDGSTARLISSELGDEAYSDAVAVGFEDKYYVSMKDSESKNHLFVYDFKKRIWHKEDSESIVQMYADTDRVVAMTGFHTERPMGLRDTALQSIVDTGKTDYRIAVENNEMVPWYAETGILSLEDINQKYISKITVRMELASGSQVTIKIRYDDSQEWNSVYTERSTRLRSVNIPIRIKRCDHMQIRFEGIGRIRIYSLAKTLQRGSEYTI